MYGMRFPFHEVVMDILNKYEGPSANNAHIVAQYLLIPGDLRAEGADLFRPNVWVGTYGAKGT